MSRVSSRTLRNRLIRTILIASAAAFLVVSAAVVAYELTTFRPRFLARFKTETTLLAQTLQSSVEFDDAEKAETYLKSRASLPEVTAISIRNPAGAKFASYRRNPEDRVSDWPSSPAGTAFVLDRLLVWEPILDRDGKPIATILLESKPPRLATRFAGYAVLLLGVLMALGAVGISLLRGLDRDFLNRLKTISDTATSVAEVKDYSVRVPDAGEDELSVLGRSFNEMLAKVAERDRALRDASERNETILRTVQDGLCLLDPDGRFLQVNPSCVSLLGHSRESLSDLTLQELVVLDGAESIPHRMKRVLSGVPELFDCRLSRKDGALIDAEISIAGVASGQPLFIASIRDVTQRRKADEAIRESDRKTRAILDSAFQFIGLLDTGGRILFANRTACEFAGVKLEAVMGKHFWDTPWWAQSETDQERLREAIERSAKGEFIRFETSHPGKDGKTVSIDFSLTPILDEQGRTTLLIPEGRDITELKRAQEALGRMETHLQQTQKLEAIGTLAGGVAHDFNNILGAIVGNASLALADLSQDHPASYSVQQIYQASQRAAGLVRQILTFSRKHENKRVPVSIEDVIRESSALLRATIPATVEIETVVTPGLSPVLADFTQLHQVVMNLGTNAAHAMKDRGGRLSIVAKQVDVDLKRLAEIPDLQVGPHVLLTVRDTGCGMAPEVMTRVFEPFFTTKAVGEGTGLGLSVVHGIIREHGGNIRMESEPGTGTTFEILLPAVVGSKAEVESPEAAATAGHGERILYVDDEPALRSVVRQMLQKSGYRVFVKARPEEALEFLRQGATIDLILSDLTMPGMSGIEMLQRVRAMGMTMPAILISGFAGAVSPNQMHEADVALVLNKPITHAPLVDAIREVLKTSASSGPTV